ncbi:MAG: hypothetical protein C5B43_00455 [Verrucomicrobia bacterium]|nr:MAG: hypothetical protein C5B43_00455 [Verrucomicrobiota bacterium]
MKRLLNTEEGQGENLVFTLGNDVSLKVFSWLLEVSLFQGAARVCKFWNGLIMYEKDKNGVLFRAVQCSYVDVHYRKGDLKLARNACEAVYNRIEPTIFPEDREYFVEKEKAIIQVLETSKEKIAFILNGLTKSSHGTCKEYIESLLDGKIINRNTELLLMHFEEIIKIFINSLNPDIINKGYVLIIFFIIEKIIFGMKVEGKIRIINSLVNVLKAEENKNVVEIMMQEAMAIYKIVVGLNNEVSIDLKYSVNCLIGWMICKLVSHGSIYQRSFWDLLLSRASNAVDEKEFRSMGNLSFAVMDLMESKQELLNIYSKEHFRQIINFLKDSYLYIGNKDKYSFFYALKYILIKFKLDLNPDDMRGINSVFAGYVESRLSSINGVKDGLMKKYTQGLELDNTDAKILIEQFPLRGLNEETFISFACGIPEKLIHYYTDEKKLEIINLFKSHIEIKDGLRNIERGFNIYLDFFHKLALNSSGKVKGEATLLIGIMALRCSECFSDRIWPIFFSLIFEEKNSLRKYIEEAINNSESTMSLNKLNFAQKIREIFQLKDKDFISLFNRFKVEFYRFLDGQLLNIKNPIKIEVILTFIYIIFHPEIKDEIVEIVENKEVTFKQKLKFSITNQLQWTPNLKNDIKIKIEANLVEIVKFCEPEKFNKYLSEELGIKVTWQ